MDLQQVTLTEVNLIKQSPAWGLTSPEYLIITSWFSIPNSIVTENKSYEGGWAPALLFLLLMRLWYSNMFGFT